MPVKHLLIVDDSKSARLVLAKMLKDQGLTVDMAASGEEALDYLRAHLPDAIFMDHTMPGMSGLQALKAIKDNPYTAKIPIAMYTSKEGETYAEQVRAQGAVDVLLKPATPNTLGEVIKRLNAAFETGAEVKEWPVDPHVASAQIPAQNIDLLVKKTVPGLINEAIRMQIIPLIEERVSKIREDILSSSENAIMEMAAKTYDKRFDTLYRHLNQQLNARINEINETVNAIKSKSDEVQKIMMSTATHDLEKSAKEMVKQMESDVLRKLDRNIEKASAPLTKRVNLIAGLAIVLSIVAIGIGVYRFIY